MALHAAAGSAAEVGEESIILMPKDLDAEVQAFINAVFVMSRTRTSYVADVSSRGC